MNAQRSYFGSHRIYFTAMRLFGRSNLTLSGCLCPVHASLPVLAQLTTLRICSNDLEGVMNRRPEISLTGMTYPETFQLSACFPEDDSGNGASPLDRCSRRPTSSFWSSKIWSIIQYLRSSLLTSILAIQLLILLHHLWDAYLLISILLFLLSAIQTCPEPFTG